MGQKINPNGIRIGINKGWKSQWCASKQDFSKFVLEDNAIRKFLKNKYKTHAISKISIERNEDKLTVAIFTARPGMVIGQKGAGVEQIKAEIAKLCKGKQVSINVIEVKSPDLDAQLVAESIASALVQRMSYKRSCKQAVARVMKAGAKGVKVMVGGRLDGVEIARSAHYQEGSLPLQTYRADIDYGFTEARIYGKIGVKVWIFKGEILGKVNLASEGGK